MGLPVGASSKEPAWQCRRHKTCRFDPWIRKIPWRRAWQPILVFLPENPMDRGIWQAAVHSVAQNRTRMNQFSGHTCKLRQSILFFFFFSAEHTHLVSEEITSINPLLSILQEIYACTLKYNIHTYILSFKWEKSDLSIMFSHYFVITFSKCIAAGNRTRSWV